MNQIVDSINTLNKFYNKLLLYIQKIYVNSYPQWIIKYTQNLTVLIRSNSFPMCSICICIFTFMCRFAYEVKWTEIDWAYKIY